MSDVWQGPGYWIASDGKWYAPETHPAWTKAGPALPEATQHGGATGRAAESRPPDRRLIDLLPEQMSVSSWEATEP